MNVLSICHIFFSHVICHIKGAFCCKNVSLLRILFLLIRRNMLKIVFSVPPFYLPSAPLFWDFGLKLVISVFCQHSVWRRRLQLTGMLVC